MFRRYFDLLERKPLQVKVITALLIFSVSDVMAQKYEHWTTVQKNSKDVTASYSTGNLEETVCVNDLEFEWDAPRTFRIASFGGVVNIWIHFWWGILERKMERIICSKTHRFKNAFFKVIVDQSFGTPVFNTIFFSSQHILQGHSLTELPETIASRLPTQLARHYTFWPMVHLFNFSFVSVHKRVIVQNVLTIGWAAYLSRCEKQFDDLTAKQGEVVVTPKQVPLPVSVVQLSKKLAS